MGPFKFLWIAKVIKNHITGKLYKT